MKIFPAQSKEESTGFVLPLVLVISLLLGAGMMALAARSWLGVKGSARQSQARQAREIAEAGVARLVESLNSDYSYLLIKDLADWDDSSFESSICPNSNMDPTTVPKVGSIKDASQNVLGQYTLIDYDFQGSPFYGGSAKLKMRGERQRGATTIAASIVEQTISVKPKNCDGSLDETVTSSGFPGLLAQFINMGNNDIKGRLSGNVLCTKCLTEIPSQCNIAESLSYNEYTEDQKKCVISANINNAEIDGEIFAGPIDLPDIPEVTVDEPESIPSITNQTFTEISQSLQQAGYGNSNGYTLKYSSLEAGAQSGTNSGILITTPSYGSFRAEVVDGKVVSVTPEIPNCILDEEIQITFCFFGSIDLSGQQRIQFDTTHTPIRAYFRGDKVVLGGKSAIVHTPSTSKAAELSLLGNEADQNNDNPDQQVLLAGGASTTNLWAFFPDGSVGINGGAKNEAVCDDSGECTGGDIYGAVWAKSWGGAKCDGCTSVAGSSSNNAQLVVPSDMGEQMQYYFGRNYAIGIRDYVAAGVTHWSSHTAVSD